MRESDYDPARDGFEIRFVTIGSQAKAEEFCARQDMAARCLGDEDKRTYRAMGLENFNLLKLLTDPALKARRGENNAAGFKQDWGATKLADGAQLPGVAIVDAAGILRWLQRGEHPGDLPKMNELIERTRALTKD